MELNELPYNPETNKEVRSLRKNINKLHGKLLKLEDKKSEILQSQLFEDGSSDMDTENDLNEKINKIKEELKDEHKKLSEFRTVKRSDKKEEEKKGSMSSRLQLIQKLKENKEKTMEKKEKKDSVELLRPKLSEENVKNIKLLLENLTNRKQEIMSKNYEEIIKNEKILKECTILFSKYTFVLLFVLSLIDSHFSGSKTTSKDLAVQIINSEIKCTNLEVKLIPGINVSQQDSDEKSSEKGYEEKLILQALIKLIEKLNKCCFSSMKTKVKFQLQIELAKNIILGTEIKDHIIKSYIAKKPIKVEDDDFDDQDDIILEEIEENKEIEHDESIDDPEIDLIDDPDQYGDDPDENDKFDETVEMSFGDDKKRSNAVNIFESLIPAVNKIKEIIGDNESDKIIADALTSCIKIILSTKIPENNKINRLKFFCT